MTVEQLPETETGAAFAAGQAVAEADQAAATAATAEAIAAEAEATADAAVVMAAGATEAAAEAEAEAWSAQAAVADLEFRVMERLDQLAANLANLAAGPAPTGGGENAGGPPPPEASEQVSESGTVSGDKETASDGQSGPKKAKGNRYGARSWFGD